ncbi:MAG: hypothetical protein GXP58_06115 [Deltaproteobacteria bacterium]|nr:hypothetical protein [Deltaproteobacteria bacterium]
MAWDLLFYYGMNDILLCSSDPIFIKNLYGILREDGYRVDIAGHASMAVRMVFEKSFAAVILDSDAVGMSSGEAARIILRVISGIPVILAGESLLPEGAFSISKPLDLEEVLEVLRTVRLIHFPERSVSGL